MTAILLISVVILALTCVDLILSWPDEEHRDAYQRNHAHRVRR